MQYQRLGTHNWTQWREAILLLEAQIYEPSRQDTPETLERIICNERGISLAAVEGRGWRDFALVLRLRILPMFAAPQKIRRGGAVLHFTQQTRWWTRITGAGGSAGNLKFARSRLPAQRALRLSAAAIGWGSQMPCGDSIPRLAPVQFI